MVTIVPDARANEREKKRDFLGTQIFQRIVVVYPGTKNCIIFFFPQFDTYARDRIGAVARSREIVRPQPTQHVRIATVVDRGVVRVTL